MAARAPHTVSLCDNTQSISWVEKKDGERRPFVLSQCLVRKEGNSFLEAPSPFHLNGQNWLKYKPLNHMLTKESEAPPLTSRTGTKKVSEKHDKGKHQV